MSKVNTLPQAAKPMGIRGYFLAEMMEMVHQGEYRAVSKALKLTPEDKHLDIGCGSGAFLVQHTSKAKNIAGLDHSSSMIRMSKFHNFLRVRKGTAEFRQGDAAKLPWHNESFTSVSAIATFMFWPNPETSLREIFRVLSPRSRLVISLGWNADDGLDHTKHIKKYGIRLYGSKELEGMMKDAGFQNVSVTKKKSFMMPQLLIFRADK